MKMEKRKDVADTNLQKGRKISRAIKRNYRMEEEGK